MIILMFFMVLHLRDDSPPRAGRFSATCRTILRHVQETSPARGGRRRDYETTQ